MGTLEELSDQEARANFERPTRRHATWKITNHHLLEKLEEMLKKYINSDDLLNKGLPTVQYIAGELNISPNYLGSLLKTLTQQTTKQIIQEKIIQKAKEKLDPPFYIIFSKPSSIKPKHFSAALA